MNLRPNQPLANIVEIAKKLQEEKLAEGNWRVCARHQEPLKLFCQEDQAPICLVCDRSKNHEGHRVLPIDEEFQEYKIQLELEKQKARSAFEGMQEFLQEKQHLWLGQLEVMEKEMEKKEEEKLTELSQEISQLSLLITEEKLLQPASEFLQNITNDLSRCEKNLIQYAVDLSPKLEERLRIYSQKNSDLKRAMKNCEESLEDTQNTANLEQTLNTASVALDPDTANTESFLSEDLKTVRWDAVFRDLASNPERFDCISSVLGRERFTSGRHWWEAEVQEEEIREYLGEEQVWATGVARDTVTRKGYVDLDPHEGIWAVGKVFHDLFLPCQVSAFPSIEPVPLTLRKEPRKIRVTLDYEEGCVDFFDADTDDFIFTFHAGSFSGETI